MKARAFDPLKLDVEAFVRQGGDLSGEWSAPALSRLAESADPQAPAEGWPPVRWRARGELRPLRQGEPGLWLHLDVQAEVHPTCQRCLQPVGVPLNLQRSLRFVRDEATAAQLDEDSEDDVLALSRALNLRTLIEDELVLAWPLVPRHEDCMLPAGASRQEALAEEPAAEAPHPFAALAALRKD